MEATHITSNSRSGKVRTVNKDDDDDGSSTYKATVEGHVYDVGTRFRNKRAKTRCVN